MWCYRRSTNRYASALLLFVSFPTAGISPQAFESRNARFMGRHPGCMELTWQFRQVQVRGIPMRYISTQLAPTLSHEKVATSRFPWAGTYLLLAADESKPPRLGLQAIGLRRVSPGPVDVMRLISLISRNAGGVNGGPATTSFTSLGF